MEYKHIPVMLEESIKYLNLKKGDIIVDMTMGYAGHSLKFLDIIGKEGILIGFEQDYYTYRYLKELFKEKENVFIFKINFSQLKQALNLLKIKKVDKFFFDLGLNMIQLKNAKRGFSYRENGPLDMRMNTRQKLTAYHVVNRYSRNELIKIFRDYGDEYYAKRIANNILKKRERGAIETTNELVNIIFKSYPDKRRRKHPARKVFQALRIYVNNELENLKKALKEADNYLNENGTIVVISYHSLEDKIVKQFFKDNNYKIITKKPVKASIQEIRKNKSSKSAKLRAGIKYSRDNSGDKNINTIN